jgi:hypothetical protein
MNKIRKASVGVGLAVALTMIGLTGSHATAQAQQCGYYTDASGTARYLNCIADPVIVRVEHQNGHPSEDRCVPGWADVNLGPSTEIKWAWAIGGSPGGQC